MLITMLQKSFNILAISLNVLHNHFDDPKLFSDLYLPKFIYFRKIVFFLNLQRCIDKLVVDLESIKIRKKRV